MKTKLISQKNVKNVYVRLKNSIEELWDDLDRDDFGNVSKIEKRLVEEIRRSAERNSFRNIDRIKRKDARSSYLQKI